MKHPTYPTLLLAGWFVVAILIALLMPKLLALDKLASPAIPAWGYIVIVLGALALGTLAWTFMLRKANPDTDGSLRFVWRNVK